MQQPAHLSAQRYLCQTQTLVIYYPSRSVLKQRSNTARVTVEWQWRRNWLNRICALFAQTLGGSATSASLLQWLGLAVIMGSVQFRAAMTTDNATLPMATAVAPNSHFQLRACGQTGINECRADVEVFFFFFFFLNHEAIKNQSKTGLRCSTLALALSHASNRRFVSVMSWETSTNTIRTERLTHPWRFGPVFQVDVAAGGVPQHLFVHGLLCPSLLRVFFHQLGKLRVDGLHQGDKTKKKKTSAMLLCANPRLNYLWLKYSQGPKKVLCKSFGWAFQRGSLVTMRYKLCLCKKQTCIITSLWFSLHMSTIFQDMGVAFVPTPSQTFVTRPLLKLRND